MPAESRPWFEKGIFELGVAQAHLLSGLSTEGAQHARHAALKFLQAAIVKGGEPEPSPRIADLIAAATAAAPSFKAAPEWKRLDKVADGGDVDETEARSIYAMVEAVRDEVTRVIG